MLWDEADRLHGSTRIAGQALPLNSPSRGHTSRHFLRALRSGHVPPALTALAARGAALWQSIPKNNFCINVLLFD
ncbi:MAG: hypothetical protein IJT41_07040 [Clostridia bacterium]|nr:hypothetical protein [Clostridia bacterium]